MKFITKKLSLIFFVILLSGTTNANWSSVTTEIASLRIVNTTIYATLTSEIDCFGNISSEVRMGSTDGDIDKVYAMMLMAYKERYPIRVFAKSWAGTTCVIKGARLDL